MFVVTCSSVVTLRHGGIRRRGGHAFTHKPLYFHRLPKGVGDDVHLVVAEVEKLPVGTKAEDDAPKKRGRKPKAAKE